MAETYYCYKHIVEPSPHLQFTTNDVITIVAEPSPHLQFTTNDVITIECDFDDEKVYFSKNKSKQKHLVFQNVANLQSLHFCVEGCLVDFAIEEFDPI